MRELQKCLGEAGEEGGQRGRMASEDFPRAAQQGCTIQGGLSSEGGEMTTLHSGSWSRK